MLRVSDYIHRFEKWLHPWLTQGLPYGIRIFRIAYLQAKRARKIYEEFRSSKK